MFHRYQIKSSATCNFSWFRIRNLGKFVWNLQTPTHTPVFWLLKVALLCWKNISKLKIWVRKLFLVSDFIPCLKSEGKQRAVPRETFHVYPLVILTGLSVLPRNGRHFHGVQVFSRRKSISWKNWFLFLVIWNSSRNFYIIMYHSILWLWFFVASSGSSRSDKNLSVSLEEHISQLMNKNLTELNSGKNWWSY